METGLVVDTGMALRYTTTMLVCRTAIQHHQMRWKHQHRTLGPGGPVHQYASCGAGKQSRRVAESIVAQCLTCGYTYTGHTEQSIELA